MNIQIVKVGETVTTSNKTAGVVSWFNDAKGYGFIKTAEHEQIFCHYSAIKGDGFKTLVEGQTVLFDLVTGPKGPQAFEIIKGPAPEVTDSEEGEE